MEEGKEDHQKNSSGDVKQPSILLPRISIDAEEDRNNLNGKETLNYENPSLQPQPPSLSFHPNYQSRSLSMPSEHNRSRRSSSLFQEVIQNSFSEGSRLNEEKVIELEGRLKNLASAFITRTKKTKAEIRRPPTPSSEDSDSEISTAPSENNLLNRLEAFLPTPTESRRTSSQSVVTAEKKSKNSSWRKWRKQAGSILRILTFRYLLDPQSTAYILWLGIISGWFLYNAWVIPLREAFLYQTETNSHIWFLIDSISDSFYLIDIILFKSHIRFVQEGFPIQTVTESWKIYLKTSSFIIDLMSLFPADIISSIFYVNMPWLRIPRLLKIETYWELFGRLDSKLSSPYTARIGKTLLYMIYMIHLNASAYYALSRWEGHGSTEWTFGYFPRDHGGHPYIRCFYFATKTATSIGKNPKPTNEIEYLFMTFAWLSGVFVFAILIGQIRDIIATATKAQTEYRQVCYTTFNYLHRLDVPQHLQDKVKSWLNYTWAEQKTLNESMIIAQLPQKMQADIALHVHIETLSKVKLFQNCETAFLRDLVTKLRSIIFLPGDYICRKGEVGKEMYIIKTGRVDVLGGSAGHDVLATLSAGSVFGEISLLAIGGMTKRTADVKTAGFANLFVLNKADLNEAIKDYPQAQDSLRKKAKKLIRENIKKRKAEKDAAVRRKSKSPVDSNLDVDSEEKIIIKNKYEQPRFVEAVLKAVNPNSMTAKYLRLGSKANSIDKTGVDEMPSYPISPYLPSTPSHLVQKFPKSYISDSSDEDFNSKGFNIPVVNISNESEYDYEFPLNILTALTAAGDNELNQTSEVFSNNQENSFEKNISTGSKHPLFEEVLTGNDKSRFQLQRQYSIQSYSSDEDVF